MTLVVEDGTGKSDAESYISVANTDLYHEKFDHSNWIGSTVIKEAALRKATQYLDGKYQSVYPGNRIDTDQALGWPRVGATYLDGMEILDTVVPIEIINATAELALKSLSGELETDITKQDRAIKERVDIIEIVYAPGTSSSTVYKSIMTILSRLIGSGTYGIVRRT